VAPPAAPAAPAQAADLIPLPAPSVEPDSLNLPVETEAPLIPESPVEEQEFGSLKEAEASPAEAAPPKLTDDFPDPFGDAAQPPAATEDEETNPYLGKSLDESETPAALSDSIETPAVEVPLDDSTAAKMRRVIQRTDMKGLKGFCPVTLRDQRELADAKQEFSGTYRGQKFSFASKVALAKFEEDPARYAPAAYGADVVVLTDDQDVIEGTLDYAAWYKGRLYLFGSEKTHDVFVADPDRYATPPGIE
jgi:YHS domain-containing protein